MARYVRGLRIEAERHNITLTKGQSSVSVHFRKEPGAIWWDFQTLFPRENMIECRQIGNVWFQTCERYRNGPLSLNEYYCDYANIEAGTAAVSKHFQYLFNGPLNIIICPTILSNLDDMFSEPELQKCQTMEICGSEATKQALKSIFRKMTIEKKLVVRPKTDQDYVIEQAIDVEELYLKSTTWMTREHLLRLNCRIAHLSYTLLQSWDIEDFARKWLNDKKSRVERVRFEWKSDKEFALNNLPTKQWNAEQREASYIYYVKDIPIRTDCSNGYDLERDDGMLATVVVEENDNNQYVHFLVWIDLFPEKKRLEQLPEKLAPFYQKLEKINQDYPDASSLERLLSRRDLESNEFIETLRIFKNIDADNQERSAGTIYRKELFEKMKELINL